MRMLNPSALLIPPHPAQRLGPGRGRWPRPAARHASRLRSRPGLQPRHSTARAQAVGRRADQGLWASALALLTPCLGAWLAVSAPGAWPLHGPWPTPPDQAAQLWSLLGLGTLGLSLPAVLAALHAAVLADRPTGRHHARSARSAWLAGAAMAALMAGCLWMSASGG